MWLENSSITASATCILCTLISLHVVLLLRIILYDKTYVQGDLKLKEVCLVTSHSTVLELNRIKWFLYFLILIISGFQLIIKLF